ncbi:MAG: hypothetical protein J6Y13_01560, partial [Treponema sp.]|nr:hypothetical protein [Treponema sp.]
RNHPDSSGRTGKQLTAYSSGPIAGEQAACVQPAYRRRQEKSKKLYFFLDKQNRRAYAKS